MILALHGLADRSRLALAWLISVLVVLALVLPLVAAVGGLASARSRLAAAQVRTEALQTRIAEAQARLEADRNTSGLLAAPAIPSRPARFEDRIAALQANLVEAGMALDGAPEFNIQPVEADLVEHTARLDMTGPIDGLLMALLAPELAGLRLAGFDVRAVAESDGHRVQGYLVLAQVAAREDADGPQE